VPHPLSSPDLAPADVFLFPKLKTTLKGRRFQTIEDIQENAIRELHAITESAFQEAFQQWKKCWERCIASRGDYFEGFDSVPNTMSTRDKCHGGKGRLCTGLTNWLPPSTDFLEILGA